MSKRKGPSISERRKLLVGIAACVGSLAFFGYKVLTEDYDSQISFKDAQRDTSLRQRFIDSRKEHWQRPYVSGVKYFGVQPVEQPNAGATVFDDVNNFGDRKPREVRVFPKAFEGKIANEAEFLNVLVDHEIDGHARMAFEEPPGFPHTAFQVGNGYHDSIKDIYELIAYGYQLNRAKAKKISEDFIAANFGTYCRHYESLLQANPAGLKDSTLIERACAALYQDAFVHVKVRGKPLIELQGNTYYWQREHGGQIPIPLSVSSKIKLVK